MNFAPGYVAYRLYYRFVGFFRHWYIDGSRALFRAFFSFLADLDRTFAVQVTLHHFFEPLYNDWSVIGRILGVIFRSFRVLIGGGVYAVCGVIFLAVYLIWLAFPAIIIFYAAKHI